MKRASLQFQSEHEANAWAILMSGIAADYDAFDEAADDADELLERWRDRHQDLDHPRDPRPARRREPDEE